MDSGLGLKSKVDWFFIATSSEAWPLVAIEPVDMAVLLASALGVFSRLVFVYFFVCMIMST